MENAHGSRFVVDSLSSPRSFYILIPRVSPFISFSLLSFLSCRPPGSFYARHPLLHVYIRFETPCVNGGREACGAQPPGYAFRSRNRTLENFTLEKERTSCSSSLRGEEEVRDGGNKVVCTCTCVFEFRVCDVL